MAAKLLLFVKEGLGGEEYVVILDESDEEYDGDHVAEFARQDFKLAETIEVFENLTSFPTGRVLMKDG